ncbi:type II toxin-antitoxin system Phd/YefM family antitoxin [Millisia brevis]|uniref:type II toxin-antitoxin system Phd/YefM family antitoxin n=1 Tax=Millisia brevis TaxID=264148 RepID=UPI001FDF4B67|nr:hypothetical protein [Millisia brevis]
MSDTIDVAGVSSTGVSAPVMTCRLWEGMTEVVGVRDLRNNGWEVLRQVEGGERFVMTRDGTP